MHVQVNLPMLVYTFKCSSQVKCKNSFKHVLFMSSNQHCTCFLHAALLQMKRGLTVFGKLVFGNVFRFPAH